MRWAIANIIVLSGITDYISSRYPDSLEPIYYIYI
jgi:hypothetical protein